MTTTALRCWACGHRFGRRSRVWLVDGGVAILCNTCALSTAKHTEMFWTCRQHHTPAAHACNLSAGRARQAIGYPN